jgi:hypothetical protein
MRTAAVQEDPLIADTDPEYGAGLIVGEPLDVSQDHHLALPWRQIFESRFEDRSPHDSIETFLALLNPAVDRLGPLPLRCKAGGVHCVRLIESRPTGPG